MLLLLILAAWQVPAAARLCPGTWVQRVFKVSGSRTAVLWVPLCCQEKQTVHAYAGEQQELLSAVACTGPACFDPSQSKYGTYPGL
jgi:hypothetical protein